MSPKSIANIVVAEINRKSNYVTAYVDDNDNIVLTAKVSNLDSAVLDKDGTVVVNDKFSLEHTSNDLRVIGNEGDTFFQRWDSVKTEPLGDKDENQVIDIASVMLESHINLDGRTDLDRNSTALTKIDYVNYGSLNDVYSQEDTFTAGYDMDASWNLDSFRSSFTWSLEKHDNAETDAWTHVTLGSSYKLDGDKGPLRALKRFQNAIIAFQDKGIAEILFNSRTQIATQQGVPIELANSNKVDGKRYVSNKYGTVNRLSITEGKTGLFFVDDLNKVIARFDGQQVQPLSTMNFMDGWVRSALGSTKCGADAVLNSDTTIAGGALSVSPATLTFTAAGGSANIAVEDEGATRALHVEIVKEDNTSEEYTASGTIDGNIEWQVTNE